MYYIYIFIYAYIIYILNMLYTIYMFSIRNVIIYAVEMISCRCNNENVSHDDLMRFLSTVFRPRAYFHPPVVRLSLLAAWDRIVIILLLF